MVKSEPEHQNCEIQRWVVVVYVGDTRHRDERNVVQKPTNNRVETCIVNMVDPLLVKIIITALPPDEVEYYHRNEDTEGCGGTPIHYWVTKEEVLYDLVVPTAHAETDVEEGPLPVLRCEVVLLIRIRDECVVRGHHGNVQMDEIAEEWRLVGTNIGRGELVVPVRLDIPVSKYVARVVLLSTGDLDLFETPLREIHVTGAKVAAETAVL